MVDRPFEFLSLGISLRKDRWSGWEKADLRLNKVVDHDT